MPRDITARSRQNATQPESLCFLVYMFLYRLSSQEKYFYAQIGSYTSNVTFRNQMPSPPVSGGNFDSERQRERERVEATALN